MVLNKCSGSKQMMPNSQLRPQFGYAFKKATPGSKREAAKFFPNAVGADK